MVIAFGKALTAAGQFSVSRKPRSTRARENGPKAHELNVTSLCVCYNKC